MGEKASKCSIGQCDKPTNSRGLCKHHYDKKRRLEKKEIIKKVREMYRRRNPNQKRHWHIMQRCYNKKRHDYERYGGRGISVASSLMDYNSFAEYVESLPRPKGATELDRIDNNGNYEKGNLRWVTRKQNGRNKRNNVAVEKICPKTGDVIAVFSTIAEAQEVTGAHSGNIQRCIRGDIKTSGGFAWRKVSPPEQRQ